MLNEEQINRIKNRKSRIFGRSGFNSNKTLDVLFLALESIKLASEYKELQSLRKNLEETILFAQKHPSLFTLNEDNEEKKRAIAYLRQVAKNVEKAIDDENREATEQEITHLMQITQQLQMMGYTQIDEIKQMYKDMRAQGVPQSRIESNINRELQKDLARMPQELRSKFQIPRIAFIDRQGVREPIIIMPNGSHVPINPGEISMN